MMGDRHKALEAVNYRRDLRDSLNSDMLFESINEINTEMGMTKMQEEASRKEAAAAKRQVFLLIIAIVCIILSMMWNSLRSFLTSVGKEMIYNGKFKI